MRTRFTSFATGVARPKVTTAIAINGENSDVESPSREGLLEGATFDLNFELEDGEPCSGIVRETLSIGDGAHPPSC